MAHGTVIAPISYQNLLLIHRISVCVCVRNCFKRLQMFTAFHLIFYSYLCAGNQLGLILVIFFKIEHVCFAIVVNQ